MFGSIGWQSRIPRLDQQGMVLPKRVRPRPSPGSPGPRRHRGWRLLASLLRIVSGVVLLGSVVVLAWLGHDEIRQSRLQAKWLSEFAATIVYRLEPGPAGKPLPPDRGPYDVRLGYAQLPQFSQRLERAGYAITYQAVPSRRMSELAAHGLFNVYPEKARAGLRLDDATGSHIQRALYPRNVYADFSAVPPLVVRTLLYVEDRELLDPSRPNLNPVVDWERLAVALGQQSLKMAGRQQKVVGASTLATQLEKFRHSPDGITRDARDKLLQMASASLRVYRDGPYTLPARQRLVLDYLNALPLAAQRGYGEVASLGDGMESWFGADFAQMNRVLADAAAPLEERAWYYKRVLALILAVRRPSHYLGGSGTELESLANSYLRRMRSEGVIAGDLAVAAQRVPLELRSRTTASPVPDFTRQKGVNLARSQLLSLLGVNSLYELDRLDLTVETTLDAAVQRDVTEFLRGLASAQRIHELGLDGERLLRASDPSRVIYSFTLYERGEGMNRLRVNADNLDQPLDINSGARLDLGSTAKLRTLVTWLELIAEAYASASTEVNPQLARVALHPRDRLSAWVYDHLASNPHASLRETLEAAMHRRFSASTAQSFYTGGGVHRFSNFESRDNQAVLEVAEAMRRSVNLVFIRMMREIIDHQMYRAPSTTARLLENANDPGRGEYLRRFADREGTVFLRRFYRKYRGKDGDAALDALLDGVRVTPRALVVTVLSVRPGLDAAGLRPWFERHLPDDVPSVAEIAALAERYAPHKFDLNDRGYLARVHPLELWLIDYLRQHPDASESDMLAAGAEVRQEVYSWLMKTSRRRAQDRRILDLLEIEAFQELHRRWRALGYPFASLTPSLATSIGSSGDRPAALAELMGIIVNGGVRYPSRLSTQLHFAADTPYEVVHEVQPAEGRQLLHPEVAAVVHAALLDVAERGTARALQSSLARPDGSRHRVGGKTGTGDHRFEVYGGRGRLIESRVVNRVATFVFLIDDRFFGTITAFVPGAEAAQYKFTSGLPVRLLGELMPILAPLLDSPVQEPSIIRPPSTASTCPVMKRDSSPTRNASTGARSCLASPILPPSGIIAASRASSAARDSGSNSAS